MNALQDLFCRERTELGFRIHRVASLQCAHTVNELFKKTVVNLIGDDESLCSDTGLTGVDRARFDCGAQRRFEVCTWHENKCIAAS